MIACGVNAPQRTEWEMSVLMNILIVIGRSTTDCGIHLQSNNIDICAGHPPLLIFEWLINHIGGKAATGIWP